MHGRVDQSTIIMLPVNFNKGCCHSAQRLHAHRLIIDKSARAPISHLHAAQNEIAIDVDLLQFCNVAGGMFLRQIESGRYLPLRFAGAHKRTVTAPAERKRESIQED
jgi:hypothetical protein